jgi:hypothetical protein
MDFVFWNITTYIHVAGKGMSLAGRLLRNFGGLHHPPVGRRDTQIIWLNFNENNAYSCGS